MPTTSPRTAAPGSRAVPHAVPVPGRTAPPEPLPAARPRTEGLAPAEVLRLQRALGNRAVTRMLAPEGRSRTDGGLQRFHDPATVGTGLGAALLYIRQNGRRIFDAYKALLIATDEPKYGVQTTLAQEARVQEIVSRAPVMATIKTEVGLPGAVTGVYSTDDVATIVRTLNAMEQEVGANATGSLLPSSYKGMDGQLDVRIGTEFTFSHDNLMGMKVGQGSESKAKGFVDAWVEYVTRKSPFKPTVGPAARAKSTMARTFTYVLEKGKTWSWTLDLDDSCLETQTDPSTLNELGGGLLAPIIQKDLFGGAEAVGVKPDPGPKGGGGHISLDAATTFGGSAELFLATLQELQNGYKQWQGYFQDEDRLNAPWAVELMTKKGPALKGLNEVITDLLGRVRAGTLDLNGAVQGIKNFNQTLSNPEAEKLKDSKISSEQQAGNNVASNPHHYQAINVEHMDQPGGSARIELRRIPAQVDFKKFLEDMGVIFTLIREIRQEVLKEQKTRLG